MFPPSIQKLIKMFSKFPTVGPKTAARFVFYLLKTPDNDVNELIKSINKLKESIKTCSFCFNSFEEESSQEINQTEKKAILCPICKNPARERTILCIVEKETDIFSLEKIKKYNGLYFVLGGTIASLKKDDIKKLRIKELEERIKSPQKFIPSAPGFKEIIIATNPTIEGEETYLYLKRLLKPFEIKITRLGRGLPIGAELEYADEETLSSALEGRK